jgi:hypothetical protein
MSMSMSAPFHTCALKNNNNNNNNDNGMLSQSPCQPQEYAGRNLHMRKQTIHLHLFSDEMKNNMYSRYFYHAFEQHCRTNRSRTNRPNHHPYASSDTPLHVLPDDGSSIDGVAEYLYNMTKRDHSIRIIYGNTYESYSDDDSGYGVCRYHISKEELYLDVTIHFSFDITPTDMQKSFRTFSRILRHPLLSNVLSSLTIVDDKENTNIMVQLMKDEITKNIATHYKNMLCFQNTDMPYKLNYYVFKFKTFLLGMYSSSDNDNGSNANKNMRSPVSLLCEDIVIMILETCLVLRDGEKTHSDLLFMQNILLNNK